MNERIDIVEDPDVNARLAGEVASWGNLNQTDRYESANVTKYEVLINLARENVSQSIFAAALVSAWDGQAVRSPYNYGENILSARKVAEDVTSMQDFAVQNPNEVGLYIGEYHMIIFKFAEMRMKPYYHGQSERHGYIRIEAPIQTGLTLHSGQVSTDTSVSDRGDDGRRGNYQMFSVNFNELHSGVVPKMIHSLVRPLTFGRQAIADYFRQQAFSESSLGGTTNRRTSLPYALWRLRGEDDELTKSVDETAESFDLVGLWTEQYRREIGAKAAHVLLRNMLDESSTTENSWRERSILSAGGWFDEEPSIFGEDPQLYLEAAAGQAKRIGVFAEERTLINAINFVFK